MKQKFIFKAHGQIFIRKGVYEDILAKFNPEWIDCWYEWEKQ